MEFHVPRSRTASSHPLGVENDRVPVFGKSPIRVLEPSLGSIHDALTVSPAVILSILMETVVLLLK
jgi:hypothetical protein